MSTPSVAIEQEGDHYTLLLVSFEQTLDNALDDKNDDSLPKAIKKVLDEAEDETPKVFTDFFFFLMTHLRALMEQGKTDVVLRVLGVFKGTAPPSDYHQELLNLGLDGFLEACHHLGINEERHCAYPDLVGTGRRVFRNDLFAAFFDIIPNLFNIGWLKCDHIFVRVISWALEYEPEKLDHFDPDVKDWDERAEKDKEDIERHDRKAYAKHRILLDWLRISVTDPEFMNCLAVNEETESPTLYDCGPLYAKTLGGEKELVKKAPVNKARKDFWKARYRYILSG